MAISLMDGNVHTEFKTKRGAQNYINKYEPRIGHFKVVTANESRFGYPLNKKGEIYQVIIINN